MEQETPKSGKPGTIDQSPRWEGPEETRPRGYLPAKDDPQNDPDALGERSDKSIPSDETSAGDA